MQQNVLITGKSCSDYVAFSVARKHHDQYAGDLILEFEEILVSLKY